MQFHQQRNRSKPDADLYAGHHDPGQPVSMRSVSAGAVKPAFAPTPTPTRISTNYALEGQTHFQAGDLAKAIEAYKLALQQEPQNIQLWSELARIQGLFLQLDDQ